MGGNNGISQDALEIAVPPMSTKNRSQSSPEKMQTRSKSKFKAEDFREDRLKVSERMSRNVHDFSGIHDP